MRRKKNKNRPLLEGGQTSNASREGYKKSADTTHGSASNKKELALPAPPQGGSVRKFGYATIIGAPNAGKSTLTNALVGGKIAIVTPKVQTTRNKIQGIFVEGDTQIVLVDTPGIFDAKAKFEQAMVKTAYSALSDADLVIWLIDASTRNPLAETADIAERLKPLKKPVWVVLNKIDKIEKTRIFELSQAFHTASAFETFVISAENQKDVVYLRKQMLKHMPHGEWLYPEDQMATQSLRDIAAEITREKCFLRLRQELPYSVHVDTESWEEKKALTKIRQVIYVQTESHKKILLGKGGEMLKAIGIAARKDIERQTQTKVHLELFIKVRENWKDDRSVYEKLGLEYKQ